MSGKVPHTPSCDGGFGLAPRVMVCGGASCCFGIQWTPMGRKTSNSSGWSGFGPEKVSPEKLSMMTCLNSDGYFQRVLECN